MVTFGKESSKQAIQTAARGLGIDVDISLYISSLIPTDRGLIRTLNQCYYGDEENEFRPIVPFVKAMEEYPELWEVAKKIEGLICRVSEHAGGVIFADEPFYKSTALMKVPNGDVVTQFDLHDSEKCSLIKMDLLSVEYLDKIHTTLNLLEEYDYITPEPTLKETYEKYLGIYNIERKNPKMWEMVWNHEIQSLFQMEKQSGIKGISLVRPESIDDLAVLNSAIRLMAQGEEEEQPLDKYARFKRDINEWYREMDECGLTKEEQKIIRSILDISYGMCVNQEQFMALVQIPECGGFNLSWSDRLRKAVAKKSPKDYQKLEKEYYENAKEKNLSIPLCEYVWKRLVSLSRGYGFNSAHTTAYSLVALQEMNLAFRFPIIFWNCACLIVDSGGLDENDNEILETTVDIYEPEDFEVYDYTDSKDKKTKKKIKRKTTDYKKVAVAIGKMKDTGIKVVPPDINTSKFTFAPDVKNNSIIYGIKGMLNVGDDLVIKIIKNRPYKSPKDFKNKVKPNKQAMISLIKAGAFDNLMDRKECMVWFLYEVCDKKKRITLQNMRALIKYDLIPDTDKFNRGKKIFEFNKYLKSVCKYSDKLYKLDSRAIDFLIKRDYSNLIKQAKDGNFYIIIKSWDKIYQAEMNVFREWIDKDKDKILNELNTIIFKEEWEKNASGSYSAWEMEALCYYHHEHELKNVNTRNYGIKDFFKLPENPEVDRVFKKGGKEIPIYKLNRIIGTCIAKDKDKATISLLTPTGVVTVKFRKEYFSMFDKQISRRQADGTKKIIEKSWFNRGNKLIIQGVRRGEEFVAKKYSSSSMHTIYKIDKVKADGSLVLIDKRADEEGE